MTYVNQEGAQLDAQGPGLKKPKQSCPAAVKTRSDDDVKDVYY